MLTYKNTEVYASLCEHYAESIVNFVKFLCEPCGKIKTTKVKYSTLKIKKMPRKHLL